MARERIEIAAGDRRITGVTTRPGRAQAPILVALHGGTYTSAYFDVPGLSFLDLAEATGFTAVSLDRPGHGGSDPLDGDTPGFAGSATVLETSAPWTVASLFRGAGHNIDHHHLGRTLHLEQLAFAWACVHHRSAALVGWRVGRPDGVDRHESTEHEAVSRIGHGLDPVHQAAPTGCRTAALSRFQTLIAEVVTSSAESASSS